MSEDTQATEDTDREQAHRREFRSYVWGVGLALLLTLVPFAMVKWDLAAYVTLLVVIGVLAVLQMAVHFRFFLHLSLNRNREDLQLILFSALLLTIMVAGTLWIMTNLAARMTMPM